MHQCEAPSTAYATVIDGANGIQPATGQIVGLSKFLFHCTIHLWIAPKSSGYRVPRTCISGIPSILG